MDSRLAGAGITMKNVLHRPPPTATRRARGRGSNPLPKRTEIAVRALSRALGRCRTRSRTVVPALSLVLVGLITDGAGHAQSAPGGACAGLALYKSQPYATEKGAHRRCDLLREIDRGGALSSHPLRDEMLEELSNRFAIELRFTGTVELPGRVIDYLLENMPEAAALVSTYTGKEYMATQVDGISGPESFFVTNTDSFAADFEYLFSRTSPTVSRHIFFESGQARVLFWRVWGNSFVRYKLEKDGEASSSYDIKVDVFTNSRLLRTVLDTGLFNYFADRMFRGILGDIEAAVRGFTADANPREHLPPYFVIGLNGRLAPDAAPLSAR